MSPQDGSCQKFRNCVYICLSYAEKTVASFSGHGVIATHLPTPDRWKAELA